MNLTFTNNQFVCETSFSERHIPKSAKFKWNGNNWVSDSVKSAAKLVEFADEIAKSKIEDARKAGLLKGVRSLTEATLQKVEEEKNEAERRAEMIAKEKAAREAEWAAEKEAKIQEKNEFLRKIANGIPVSANFDEKDIAKNMGCAWNASIKQWVAFSREVADAVEEALKAHRVSNPQKEIELFTYLGCLADCGDKYYFHVGEIIERDGHKYYIYKTWERNCRGDDSENATAHGRARLATEADLQAAADKIAREEAEKEALKQERQRVEMLEGIFSLIKREGDYPNKNESDIFEDYIKGEQIKIQNKNRDYSWAYTPYKIVIGKEFIWSVQPNGMDGDCWADSNHGTSILHKIPFRQDLADRIRELKGVD